MSEFNTYQHELKKILFPIYHNTYHRPAGNTDIYVAYTIKDDILRNYLHYWYMFQTAEDFDFEWYEQCKHYIQSLHPQDQYRIRCYSHVSYEFVNQYLRSPDQFLATFPIQQKLHKMEELHLYFFLPDLVEEEGIEMGLDAHGILSEDFYSTARSLMHTHISNNYPRLIQYIMKYIDHLRRILHGAPRSSIDYLVFRGVASDYLSSEKPGMFRGFTSATWYPQIAYTFGEGERMIYELRVSKDIPALCIKSISQHDEYEVLIDTDIWGVADRSYQKYYLDIYQGSGEFPAIHMWNPDETELEGTPKRIFMNSRVVFVAPEQSGLQGGFAKNRTRTHRSHRVRKTFRKSQRSSQVMFDQKDLSSPAFVPTSSPVGHTLLQVLREYQMRNPRRKTSS